MTDTNDDEEFERIEALEDELGDAIEDAEEAIGPESEPDPEVRRLYAELRDLDAAGTSATYQTALKIVELDEAGESGRDIARRASRYGIAGCTSQPRVVRLLQFARLVSAARDQIEGFTVPAEHSMRRLCAAKSPAGDEWTIAERLEFLIDAVALADSEGQQVTAAHVRSVLDQRWPRPPRAQGRPSSPAVRKLSTALERLGREQGADNLLRACQLYLERHSGPDGAETEPEQ
jgi:hypothetical protein